MIGTQRVYKNSQKKLKYQWKVKETHWKKIPKLVIFHPFLTKKCPVLDNKEDDEKTTNSSGNNFSVEFDDEDAKQIKKMIRNIRIAKFFTSNLFIILVMIPFSLVKKKIIWQFP